MKPLRTSDLTHATPVDGRGHGRTPAVQLLLDERDALLKEAARFFPDVSDREVARQLRVKLLRLQTGSWRRSRTDLTCPAKRDTLAALLWTILKVRDYVPSERLIRLVLSRR